MICPAINWLANCKQLMTIKMQLLWMPLCAVCVTPNKLVDNWNRCIVCLKRHPSKWRSSIKRKEVISNVGKLERIASEKHWTGRLPLRQKWNKLKWRSDWPIGQIKEHARCLDRWWINDMEWWMLDDGRMNDIYFISHHPVACQFICHDRWQLLKNTEKGRKTM